MNPYSHLFSLCSTLIGKAKRHCYSTSKFLNHWAFHLSTANTIINFHQFYLQNSPQYYWHSQCFLLLYSLATISYRNISKIVFTQMTSFLQMNYPIHPLTSSQNHNELQFLGHHCFPASKDTCSIGILHVEKKKKNNKQG